MKFKCTLTKTIQTNSYGRPTFDKKVIFYVQYAHDAISTVFSAIRLNFPSNTVNQFNLAAIKVSILKAVNVGH